MEPNMLGAYGPWAASLVPEGPARLSFRNARFTDLTSWRNEARAALVDRLMSPPTGGVPRAELQHSFEFDGLTIEHLQWQIPYGPPTEAYVLKPKGSTGKLPAVLALHDHGGNKYFGTRKIVRLGDEVHPTMKAHQELYYGGVGWANELAKRGYVVLVHDAFLFASRRIRVGDVPRVIKKDLKEVNPESEAEIKAYNTFASNHESVVAKSLFCAGTTWPGVFVSEDQRALDYLCQRPDVDASRVGCGGLSGGGLRTIFLAGMDDRIAAACCAGMMTTWKDYLLHKSHTHTWMVYVPGISRDLDYPEILGLRAPRPTLVLNCEDDDLFSISSMREADTILGETYEKAGVGDRYKASFYPGPHKFDRPMQSEAFDWFDRWLSK